MPVGAGLSGSGATATGWTDSGWANGSDSRFQTADPVPHLTYQISGGALLDGSDRAVQLTTTPEPVPSGLFTSRMFPQQNTTVYFSFLVRPNRDEEHSTPVGHNWIVALHMPLSFGAEERGSGHSDSGTELHTRRSGTTRARGRERSSPGKKCRRPSSTLWVKRRESVDSHGSHPIGISACLRWE